MSIVRGPVDPWYDNTATPGVVRVTSTSTLEPLVHVHQEKDEDCWSFDFAVQGLTEGQADALAEDITLLLCGRGWFRHTWVGRRLLGCKRLVVGAWKPLPSNDHPTP